MRSSIYLLIERMGVSILTKKTTNTLDKELDELMQQSKELEKKRRGLVRTEYAKQCVEIMEQLQFKTKGVFIPDFSILKDILDRGYKLYVANHKEK